jgi:hypothetical protein
MSLAMVERVQLGVELLGGLVDRQELVQRADHVEPARVLWHQAVRTFAARGPFSVLSMSNSTRESASRVLCPSPSMAE